MLDQKNKPYLQGWAVVENPTSEDWNGVEMALISGRPISFQMDLYNPLYISRPNVEPELFASLRPQTYSGALRRDMLAAKTKDEQVAALLREYNRLVKEHKFEEAKNIATQANELDPNNPATTAMMEMSKIVHRRDMVDKGHNDNEEMNFLQIQKTLELGSAPTEPIPVTSGKDRWAQIKNRKEYAGKVAEQMKQQLDAGRSVPNVASASQLGDYFQYVIDQPVTLGRQKSALLPIINKDVEGQRVSIYNPTVQARHPLLGLKFKNTSGNYLSQGPITVFEGSTYAGDSRVLDMQPGEERLISYAIDQGTEVSFVIGSFTPRITKVKANKGVITTETLIREETVYDISNRSTTDRVLLLEHPNRKSQGFTFVGDNKPAEEAADTFRFQVSVGSKKDLSYTVREERTLETQVSLTNNTDDQIRSFINLNAASPELKAKLAEALQVKGVWDSTRRQIETVDGAIKTITKDQDRLRQNLREFPRDSEIYIAYLAKFTKQEKEMNDLDAKLADLQKKEVGDKMAYETFLGNISD